MQPSSPVIDVGRDRLPLQFRLLVWRSPVWSNFLQALNKCAAFIMQAAYRDAAVMPVDRYRQARRAFVLYQKWHSKSPVCVQYLDMCGKRVQHWKECVAHVEQQCKLQFCRQFHQSIAVNQYAYFGQDESTGVMAVLHKVHVGFVAVSGDIVKNSAICRDEWCTAGVFLWTVQC